MQAAASAGFTTATDIADWLVRVAGVPFRQAHHITGRVVKLAEEKGLDFIVEASQTLYFKPTFELTADATAAYNKANPGKPGLKAPQPEGGPRRDSFCARMKGMKKKLTSAKTANDPNSRINKSLRAWKC